MRIEKAHWLTDGDNVRVVMPISKIDAENRTVSGFATLNNVDQHDDVVTAECSADAFGRFRGNIREMHQPIAAGRMVSFTQEVYYDPTTGAAYEGIYVTAYISKGAEDTWQKVVDGTLSGFSIGGFVRDSHTEFIAELDKTIRFITAMDLFELSLVDNPANQLANVLSFQKVGDEMVAKGIATEVVTETVFWCEGDNIARASTEETVKCRECNSEMTNIGWIEVTDTPAAELKKFVDAWTTQKVITAQGIKEQLEASAAQQSPEFANEHKVGDNSDTAEKSEGGVNMSDVETVEKAAEVDEVVVDEEVTKDVTEEVAEEVAVEKVADSEEEVVEKAVEDATEEVVEKAEDATPAVDLDALTKTVSDISSAIVSLAESISEVKKSVESLSTVSEKVDSVNAALEGVGGRLDNLEKATAGKKSGEEGTTLESVTKGFSWGGHFASASTIVE